MFIFSLIVMKNSALYKVIVRSAVHGIVTMATVILGLVIGNAVLFLASHHCQQSILKMESQ